MTLRRFPIYFAACVLIAIFVLGCGPVVSTTVKIGRDNYMPKVKADDYKALHGKKILFHSILDKSANTSNLSYYNSEKTIGYDLYYRSPGEGMAQPVVSFFWYALKKGFDHAGIIILESSPVYDAELTMSFQSVTDREIMFDVLFTRGGKLIYTKTYSVNSSGVQTEDVSVLEQRQYDMLDAIVKTVLDDPDFSKMLL